MAKIYRVNDLINYKYTTELNYYKTRKYILLLLKKLDDKKLTASSSLFGAAARGDYKTGSDIDVFIAVYSKHYIKTNKILNRSILFIRKKFGITIDIHLDTVESLRTGDTYYDASFVSHLIYDCPNDVKFGVSINKIIKSGWSTKDAISARIRLAKLNLLQLQAGLTFHVSEQDGYYYGGIEKLFSRVQHTTRNILYLTGDLDLYLKDDRTKMGLVNLYLDKFKKSEISKDILLIVTTEKKYYKILNQIISCIENESVSDVDIKKYEFFVLNLGFLIPAALRFFDYNLKLLEKY